jgi:hypothetical protein
MPDPTYAQTTWVNGGAPAVDAAHLNNIEAGISSAVGVANDANHNAITQTFLQMGS